MRGLVGLVLLTSLMISGDLLAQTGTDAAPVQRDWLRNYEQASQMSSQSGRALLIHFYADWCGPCKQMEREILQSGELKAMFGTHAVAVKVNSDDRSDLVSRFGITGLPTDLIVRDGKVIWRQVGSPGRTAYLART